MPDQPKTCRTCRWFEQRERANVVNVDVFGSTHFGSGSTLIGRCNQDEAKWVVTDPPPNFGCVYHIPASDPIEFMD